MLADTTTTTTNTTNAQVNVGKWPNLTQPPNWEIIINIMLCMKVLPDISHKRHFGRNEFNEDTQPIAELFSEVWEREY